MRKLQVSLRVFSGKTTPLSPPERLYTTAFSSELNGDKRFRKISALLMSRFCNLMQAHRRNVDMTKIQNGIRHMTANESMMLYNETSSLADSVSPPSYAKAICSRLRTWYKKLNGSLLTVLLGKLT